MDTGRRHAHFFFSSRRRHTRSKRDWSSDVCSSDLESVVSFPPAARRHSTSCAAPGPATDSPSVRPAPPETRSEERRVGKEGRTRWRPSRYKQEQAVYQKQMRTEPIDNETKGNWHA